MTANAIIGGGEKKSEDFFKNKIYPNIRSKNSGNFVPTTFLPRKKLFFYVFLTLFSSVQIFDQTLHFRGSFGAKKFQRIQRLKLPFGLRSYTSPNQDIFR